MTALTLPPTGRPVAPAHGRVVDRHTRLVSGWRVAVALAGREDAARDWLSDEPGLTHRVTIVVEARMWCQARGVG